MKGRIKKEQWKQTRKVNKWKEEKEMKKTCQVLLKSKVKLVSVVGGHLLTSLSVSGFLSARYLTVLLLRGEKTLCPANLADLGSCRQRGVGLHFFSFLWFCKDWGSDWATIITGVQFLAHALRTLWSQHSPPAHLEPLAWISHLVLHPFNQSMRCTDWEQIAPPILPLCWHWLCMHVLPALSTSVSFWKKPLCVLLWLQAMSSFPHIPTLWQVQNLSGSGLVMAYLLS